MPVQLITQWWREQKEKERCALAAGEISADECHMDELFPDAFIEQTEQLLRAFIAEIDQCATTDTGFPRVMKGIEVLVLALNEVNDQFDGSVIETGEREALCDFIDQVIVNRGIDIEALAASQQCSRYELTDSWRDW
ncbi:DUF5713 family protein [Chitinivorax sp. B]|uniref:DUF5713 family protein n=1 Tax=Chitinivorax sp. B TaxID=2502235 RepID=UPI0010F89391|nr:DUF5713 family protein [Chitinivorax sp. B]